MTSSDLSRANFQISSKNNNIKGLSNYLGALIDPSSQKPNFATSLILKYSM